LPGLSASDLADFTAGRDEFEAVETPEGGVGPIFNGSSCAACHSGGGAGGASKETVTRFGRLVDGKFDALAYLGGSLLQAKAIDPAALEHGRPSTSIFPLGTIVSMVLFDPWSQRRPRPLPASFRLALVFACSLVHGLGLAGALTDLGLDREHLLLSLAGFNAGIEAAQLAVAVLAAGLVSGVLRLKGPAGLALTTRLDSLSAFAAGSVWLVQRVAFRA
jgi:hypothetical protein